jgi:hypothetical protein
VAIVPLNCEKITVLRNRRLVLTLLAKWFVVLLLVLLVVRACRPKYQVVGGSSRIDAVVVFHEDRLTAEIYDKMFLEFEKFADRSVSSMSNSPVASGFICRQCEKLVPEFYLSRYSQYVECVLGPMEWDEVATSRCDGPVATLK